MVPRGDAADWSRTRGISTVALAGQICRVLTVSDHGIDIEIEFTSDTGEAPDKSCTSSSSLVTRTSPAAVSKIASAARRPR
jgi:hypothetical protein